MSKRKPVREGTFVEGPDGGTLLANKCGSCGQIFFPKVQLCLRCFDQELEEISLSRRGRLYAYTVSHMPSIHFGPPYAIGYVDMPEGVRIFAPLKIVEDKSLKIGIKMKVVIEKLWQEEDTEVVGYKFMPVKND